MDFSKISQKLIAAARMTPPSDHVPYAFEKRIMAQIASLSPVDPLTLWGRALSRSAVFCVAIVILLSAVSFALPSAPGNQESLSQDIDQTVLASAVNPIADLENQ